MRIHGRRAHRLRLVCTLASGVLAMACGELDQDPGSEITGEGGASSPGFVRLGSLSGGVVQQAWGELVSDDGTAIVLGSWEDSGREAAWRWTAEDGFVEVGPRAWHGITHATGISADGRVVVGWSDPHDYETHARAWHWRDDQGVAVLEPLPGDTDSSAYCVSPDGATVVGRSWGDGRGNARWAVWTADGGMAEVEGAPAAGYHHRCVVDDELVIYRDMRIWWESGGETWVPEVEPPLRPWGPDDLLAATPDGEIFVGVSNWQAFRWSAAGGLEKLPSLPDATSSSAAVISSDGSMVFGESDNEMVRWAPDGEITILGRLDPDHDVAGLLAASRFGEVAVGYSDELPFRWTEASGMQVLPMPPRERNSWPVVASADGRVVAGEVNVAEHETEPFVWTASDGMRFLEPCAWADEAYVRDVSADGEVVVGHCRTDYRPPEPTRGASFRWTAERGFELLEDVAGLVGSGALVALSADGEIGVAIDRGRILLWHRSGEVEAFEVVGSATTSAFRDVHVSSDGSSLSLVSTFDATPELYRWTREAGLVELGWLEYTGQDDLHILAMTPDGAAFVGISGTQPYRWTAAGGLESLGLLEGHDLCRAEDVSDDGQIVVGTCEVEVAGHPMPRKTAFRWTAHEGITSLGHLDGDDNSLASSISPDGRWIVGASQDRAGDAWSFARPFIWSVDTGMRVLDEHLAEALGAPLPLRLAREYWRDEPLFFSGPRTLVGDGFDERDQREGWVVRLPD